MKAKEEPTPIVPPAHPIDDPFKPRALPEPGESAARGALLLSGAQALLFVANAALYIVAGRVLSTDAYGRFVIAFVFLSWLNPVALTTILSGLKKIVSEDQRRLPAALAFGLKWHSLAMLVLAVVFCGAAPLVSQALNDPKLTVLLLFIGLQMPLLGLTKLGVALFESIQRFLAAAAIRLVHSLLTALGAGVGLVVGLGAAGAMGGTCAGAALGAMAAGVLLMSARRGMHPVPYPEMSRRARYWTMISLPCVLGHGTLLTLDLWFVKGTIPNPAAAGMYAAAYCLSHFPLFLGYGLADAAFPHVSGSLAADEPGQARTAARQSMRILMIAFLGISCITAACAPEIVAFVFSSRYVGASPCLVVLVPAMYFASQMHLSLRLTAAADHPGRGLAVMAVLVVIAVVLNVVLVPRLAILGAALASLITFGIGALAGTILVYRYLSVWPSFWTAVRSSAAGIVVYVLCGAWPVVPALVLVKLAVSSLIYVLLLVAARELRKTDLIALRLCLRQ